MAAITSAIAMILSMPGISYYHPFYYLMASAFTKTPTEVSWEDVLSLRHLLFTRTCCITTPQSYKVLGQYQRGKAANILFDALISLHASARLSSTKRITTGALEPW